MLQARVGSQKVVFDTRLFSAKTLITARTKQFRDLGLSLDRGESHPTVDLKSHTLISGPDGRRETVYLLGFEFDRAGEEFIVDTEEAQDAMLRWRLFAEQAITKVDQILLNDEVKAKAKCHGIWYLNTGLRAMSSSSD